MDPSHLVPKLNVAVTLRGWPHRRASAAATPRTIDRRLVGDVMTCELVTIAPHTLSVHAERLAKSSAVHHLLVVDGVRLEGVLCLCDLWRAETDSVAADLMNAPATIDSLATAIEAAEMMRELALGCLPVLDGDRLSGILTRGDLRRAGLFGDEETTRTCAACGTRHHVRSMGDAVVAFCLDCVERGRAFDLDDPLEDLGGQG